MIGPALQGASLISRGIQAIPWLLTGATVAPDAAKAVKAVGSALNRPAAPYNPGGGGMGGRRGTRGPGTYQPSTTEPRPIGSQAVLGGQPVYWGGKDYGWQRLSGGGSSTTMNTLNAPGVQNRFIQDADYGVSGGGQVSSPAAERAYQQEKSRVAQITAQDPMLQWAQANPTLAAKVQPGQAGFDVIQKQTGQVPAPSFNPLMQRTFGYQTGGGPTSMGEPTLGPSPLTPQVDQALNPASPTFVGGEGAPLFNFADEKLTPEMIEAYQRQLLGQAKNK